MAPASEPGSTGVGNGVALHARLRGLARLREGIDFAAVDDQSVDIVFLLLLPEAGDGALGCHLLTQSGHRDLLDAASFMRFL